jgi:phosphoglycolate phosphatase-like HAD superfamily hydrolase
MERWVFFDIDGTLIERSHTKVHPMDRFVAAATAVFGRTATPTAQMYEGYTDRGILWNLVKPLGINRRTFLVGYPACIQEMLAYLTSTAKKSRAFTVTPGSVRLLTILTQHPEIHIGLLSGNAEPIAWWKLSYTNLSRYFRFGVFGDVVDRRAALGRYVQPAIRTTTRRLRLHARVTIIGDTMYDILGGKAIGATTVAVSRRGSNNAMRAAKPDLTIRSLTDPSLLTLLGVME